MQLDTLRIFCDLIELRSFSKTAEKHFLSQSAVSQQLGQLETSFKTAFLDRRKRPFELTNTGEVFYEACKDILSRYEQMVSDINGLKRNSDGYLNLMAIFSIGMHSLQPYVKKFMSRYPNVNLRVDYQNARRIYERVLQGEVDIGLVAVPRRDRNIEVYPFEEEKLVLVCSPKHPFAKEAGIDIHRLQLQKFIAFEKDLATRSLINDILSRYDVTVRKVMEFDNVETIKRAVEINSGVSILPLCTLKAELSNNTLKAIPFSNEDFVRPTGIIFRKNKAQSEAEKFLIELLRKKGS